MEIRNFKNRLVFWLFEGENSMLTPSASKKEYYVPRPKVIICLEARSIST